MTVEQKIKNNEFPTFADYEREMKAFQQFFIENGPQGPNRKMIMLEYCLHAENETSEIFARKLVSDLDLEKALAQEASQNYQMQIAELKDEARKQIDETSLKIRNLESLKAELTAKEQGLRESYNSLLKEKASSEKELKEKLDEEKKASNRDIKDLKEKINLQEEQISMMQSKVATTESDSDKQQQLLKNQITHLEKNLEESKSKEKDYFNEIKNIKKDCSANIKESNAKYETQIKDLQSKLEAVKEQMAEMETKMSEAEQKYEIEKSQWQDNFGTETRKKEEANRIIADLKSQIDSHNTKFKADLKAHDEKFAKEREENQKRIASLEASLKSSEDQMKSQKTKWEKEEAFKNQNKEFLQVQLAELKKQLEESRKAHETVVKAMDLKDKKENCEETSKQIDSLKIEHLKEIKEIESNNENIRKRLTTQAEQLTEKVNELELKIKLNETDSIKEIESHKETIKLLEDQNIKLTQQIKNVDQAKLQLIEETENNYKEIMKNIELQTEEKCKKLQDDLHEAQKKSEESLAQLRKFYEEEKEKMEARIVSEKEKVQKIYSQQIEEMEQKLKDEQQQHAEEIEMLQNDLAECEAQNREVISQMEREAGLQKQRIESLQDQLKDSKEHVTRVQAMNNNALEQQVNSFSEERKSMIEKIEKMSHELTVKERELTTLENRNDSLKQEIERNTKSYDEWKNEKIEEKKNLIEKNEALKAKIQTISDDLLHKTLDSGKDLALSKQVIQHLEEKIADLNKNIDTLNASNEEKVKNIKQDFAAQLKEKTDRFTQEKEDVSLRYEQKRKALKELETNTSKIISKLEKEKSVLYPYNIFDI